MLLAWLHFSERPAPPQPPVRFAIHAPAEAGFLLGSTLLFYRPMGRDWFLQQAAAPAAACSGTSRSIRWKPSRFRAPKALCFHSGRPTAVRSLSIRKWTKSSKRWTSRVVPRVTVCARQEWERQRRLAGERFPHLLRRRPADACSGHGRRAEATVFGPDVPAPKMAQLWPRALPDGKHILFLALGPTGQRRYLRGRPRIPGNRAWFIPVRSLFEYSPGGIHLVQPATGHHGAAF